jgi:galactokinase
VTPLEDAHAALRRLGGAATTTCGYYVPGRIELLGKHTDYAGGRSLLCAVERGIRLVAAPRTDARVRIVDARSGERVELELNAGLAPSPGHWGTYPVTVARRIASNFPGPPSLRGADLAFASDLPPAAGLSSSSALVVAVFTALAAVNGLERRPEYRANIRSVLDLAGYLGTVENGQSFRALAGGSDAGVGTFGGSEDHTAILCSQAGVLGQYAFCPVRHERDVPFPPGWRLVIAVSGVVADKTGGARERYNRAAAQAAAILAAWCGATKRSDATLAAALASAPDAPAQMRRIVGGSLGQRFEQFLAESTEIIPAAAESLARGDIAALGPLADRSQQLAERCLENQVPETIGLARRARELGAAAASAFGAGFGGSVWALVLEDAAAEFRTRWAAVYGQDFPAVAPRAEFFVTGAGPGLGRVSSDPFPFRSPQADGPG